MAKQPETTVAPPRRNWRDIAQSGGHRRSSTGIARKRRLHVLGRWAGLGLLAVCSLGAATYGVYAASQGVPSITPESRSLSRISFRTDGVLDDRWFTQACALRPGDPMDDVDVHAVKAVMESHGQVREATVMLRMPDELVVEVHERTPVLRARVAADGKTVSVLIARDGTVYEGSNYPQETLRALPYLGGVRFRKDATGQIVPLEGMGIVATLMDTARHAYPDIYAGWRVVSCDRFTDPGAPGAVISVASRHAGEIIFAPHDFGVQVERLAQVMQGEAKAPSPREIVRIDLSLPDQAIVEFKGNTRPLAGGRR